LLEQVEHEGEKQTKSRSDLYTHMKADGAAQNQLLRRKLDDCTNKVLPRLSSCWYHRKIALLKTA
jgi:hypothetical protein